MPETNVAEKEDLDLDLIPPVDMDNLDLSVPPEYELELMAAELVGALSTYHKAEMARRAARQAGNDQERERLWKMVLLAKLQAARIQHNYPGARAIAEVVMREDAKRAQQTRARIAER